MKVSKIGLCAVAALALFFTACKKDEPIVKGSTDWPGETVKASFTGRVLDEANAPVEGAVVRVGSVQTKTDANGIFILKDQNVNSARAIVMVFKAGYFDAFRTLFVSKNSLNRTDFKLLKKTILGFVTASAGGKVAVPGGAELSFPANAVSKSGQPYSGKVNVAAKWLDPSDRRNLPFEMPGALRGLREDGSEEGLYTFGMLGVELTDASGQKLEVASGKTVQISMPIPASLRASAPASLPLWHFDETEGIWTEEGSAVRQGDSYVGSVSHFSWWNCDYPYAAVKLKMCLKDQNGAALVGIDIYLEQPNGNGAYALTDSAGCAEGLVPSGETLKMSISVLTGYDCLGTGGQFVQNIGPFTVDTDLGSIVVTPPSSGPQLLTATVAGRIVDCNGQPVSNGYALINQYGYAVADAQGVFSVSYQYCSNNAPTA